MQFELLCFLRVWPRCRYSACQRVLDWPEVELSFEAVSLGLSWLTFEYFYVATVNDILLDQMVVFL